MNMEKEAQRRSALKWLGRKLNPMEYVRYYGSEAYRRVSDTITDIDTDMRERAKEAKPDLRADLHEARMAMKNREYPKVLYYSWKLIDALDGIFNRLPELEQLRADIISEHYQSDVGGLTSTQLSEMQHEIGGTPENLSPGSVTMPSTAEFQGLLRAVGAPDPSITKEALISEAGPVQWLKENIPTYKQMEGSLLDRIFRNKMGKQKEAARAALRMAEKVFNAMGGVFDKLDSSRNDFSAYLDAAQNYKNSLTTHKQRLSSLYRENFSQTIEQMLQGQEEQPTEAPAEPAQEPQAQPEQQPEQAEQPQEPAPQEQQEIPDLETQPQPQEEPMQEAAAYVVDLVKRAKKAAHNGNKGIASALLVKASEICDDNDAVEQSITLLRAAEEVLKG
jgi:hypothetical protein